jgi:hypothetical protein
VYYHKGFKSSKKEEITSIKDPRWDRKQEEQIKKRK